MKSETSPGKAKRKDEKKSSKNNLQRKAKNTITGEFLGYEKLDKHIYFILFLVGLAIVYIGIGNQIDTTERSVKKREADIKELKAIYISEYRKLNELKTAMQIHELIQTHNIDLKELKSPPYIITTDGKK